MRFIALIGTLSFVLTGAFVGLRVLLLARRTRELPELLVGGSLFAYAALAQPMVVASRPLGEAFGPGARVLAVAIGVSLVGVSLLGLWAFTWLVFRRESAVARAVVAVVGLLAAACAVGTVRFMPEAPGGTYVPEMKLALGGLAVLFGCGMGWTAVESFRYHAMLRKRLALGLAEPAVVNRFWLWGLGCGATSALSFSMLGCVGAGLDVAAHPLPLSLSGASGTVTAACWWLTFVPPARYLRWLEGRPVASA